jgi:hypothetical protein
MRKMTMAAAAALLCSGLAVTGAQAADASMSQCRDLAKQVRQALDSNRQSANYQAAVRADHSGQDFCLNGLYKPGVANYQAALKLLGVSEATRNASTPGA